MFFDEIEDGDLYKYNRVTKELIRYDRTSGEIDYVASKGACIEEAYYEVLYIHLANHSYHRLDVIHEAGDTSNLREGMIFSFDFAKVERQA